MADPPSSPATPRLPVVSFVIPVRNDARGLDRCLRSIRDSAARAGVDCECIVVDNGSVDGSAEVARAAGAEVLVIPQVRVGELRNRGVAHARSHLVAFVDADHELDPGWVAAAIAASEVHPGAATGSPYRAPTAGSWVQRAYDGLREHPEGVSRTDWLASGNVVVDRQLFDRVGGFDTTLEACEDVDLSRRLRAAGAEIWSDPRLLSVHHGDPQTLGALFRSERWRGRNNLQVSLRGHASLRDLPSILIPVLDLLLPLAAVGCLVFGHPVLGATALIPVLVLAGLRAGRIASRAPVPWAHAAAVALTYDLARAAALVTRTRHRRASHPAPVATS